MSCVCRLLFVFALLTSLFATPLLSPRAQGLDITAANVIDLTNALDANTIYWPTETEGFKLTEVYKGPSKGPDGYFYAAYRF